MRNIIQRIKYRNLYVDLDPKDTSVTLSKKLFTHMGVMKQQEAKVIVIKIGNTVGGPIYAIELNPPIPEEHKETPMADIQFNTKYHTAGFESLMPTVSRIFYDYNLPATSPVRLRVVPQKLPGNRTCYLMIPPSR